MAAPRYDPSLSPQVLAAVGSVSVQWATLEFYMMRTTMGCLDRFKNKPSKLLAKTAFMERRAAFVEAFEWPNIPANAKNAAIILANRVKAVENKRHIIVHGLVSEYTVGNELERLPPEATKLLVSRDHPRHFYAELQNVQGIEEIANEIADVNGDLIQLFFWVWAASPHPSL
jgi:hypothetical protein